MSELNKTINHKLIYHCFCFTRFFIKSLSPQPNVRSCEGWENAALKPSLATWLTSAGAPHVCHCTSLGHTPPRLRLPKASSGPYFQHPVRPAARNVTQKPQVPQVRKPRAARVLLLPCCSAFHAIVLVRGDWVQPVSTA